MGIISAAIDTSGKATDLELQSIVQAMTELGELSDDMPRFASQISFDPLTVRPDIAATVGDARRLHGRMSRVWTDEEGRTIVWDGYLYNESPREEGVAPWEYVLRSFEKSGTASFAQLNGDFSFLIWQPRRAEVFAVRSPSGLRPLFYLRQGPRIVVSSYLAQMLNLPQYSAAVTQDYIAEYLSCISQGTLSLTPYAGVSRVLPGSYVKFTLNSTSTLQYWLPADGTTLRDSSPRLAAHFRELLYAATRRRVGVASRVLLELSGGKDSTTLAWIVSELRKRGDSPSLEAFNMWSEGSGDERMFASAVATQYEIPLIIERAARMNGRFFEGCLNPTPWSEPSTRSWAIGAPSTISPDRWIDSVIINGDGGDQLLEPIGERKRAIGLLVRRRVSTLQRPGDRLAPPHWWSYMRPEIVKRLGLRERAAARLPARVFRDLDRQRQLDNFVLNPNWHGDQRDPVAVRLFPFLDQDVVRLCFALPFEEKASGGMVRVILRHAFEQVWPDVVRRRPGKGSTLATVNLSARENWGIIEEIIDRSRLVDMGYFERDKLWTLLVSMREGARTIIAAHRIFDLEVWLQALDRRLQVV